MSDPPNSDALRKQYELVLQEYRFQVQLNWERSKHHLTFNTVVLGAAVALSENAGSWPAQAGLSALLVVGALNSYAGRQATTVGHQYYKNIRQTKSELEKILGLGMYSIQSTPGMMRDHDNIARGTPQASEQRFGSIVKHTSVLLTVLCLFSTVGALIAFGSALKIALQK